MPSPCFRTQMPRRQCTRREWSQLHHEPSSARMGDEEEAQRVHDESAPTKCVALRMQVECCLSVAPLDPCCHCCMSQRCGRSPVVWGRLQTFGAGGPSPLQAWFCSIVFPFALWCKGGCMGGREVQCLGRRSRGKRRGQGCLPNFSNAAPLRRCVSTGLAGLSEECNRKLSTPARGMCRRALGCEL